MSNTRKTPKQRKPAGYWKDVKNLRKEIEYLPHNISSDANLIMPTSKQLRNLGRRDLDNAITQMGGYYEVSKLLGIQQGSSKRPSGYWNEFETLEIEIKALLITLSEDELARGAMPTLKQLRQLKRADIVEAIQIHGGVAIVAKKLGLTARQLNKSKHYWKDWSKVEQEIRQFVETRDVKGQENISGHIRLTNRMPSRHELRAAGRGGLAEAISNYHGGFRQVAKRLGFVSMKKDAFFYDKFYNLAREVYNFTNEINQEEIMPLTATLRSYGRTDLSAAIVKYGGMSIVSQRLGLQYRVRTKEAFKDWSYFRRNLMTFIKHHGKTDEIPSSRLLNNYGRADLYQAILHHGGSRVVADEMGFKRSYWQEFYQVGIQVLDFIDTHGVEGIMPSENEFLQIGRKSLYVAVSKFGNTHVANRLGLSELSTSTQTALDTLLNRSITLYNEDDEEEEED